MFEDAGKRVLMLGLSFLLVWSSPFGALAAEFRVNVADSKGAALPDAVVMLAPKFELTRPIPVREKAEVRQQGTMFAPFVLPVSTGTNVSFPNFDKFRHHVYSFSKAKRFEIRLYGKDESNFIVFDKPGVVALGCNIHDNMLAYVYVTDAPIFATTDAEGTVIFDGLEPGTYQMTSWHPGVSKKGPPAPKDVEVTQTAISEQIKLQLRGVWGQQSPPADEDYES